MTNELLSIGELVTDEEFVGQLKYRLWDELLNRPTSAPQFPGSQPVSFARKHVEWLKREDFYVCEKSDGVRYLLYFTSPYDSPTCFLIDRNFVLRELKGLVLPSRHEGKIHVDTLLDGELICDEGEDGEKEFIYMIFDALLISGMDVTSQTLPSRLKYVQNDVVEPFKASAMKSTFPFKLEIKKMYKPYGIADLLINEIPKLRHENDGLIFTPVMDAYKAGTCERLLKWKPSELNTVDFKLSIERGAEDDEHKYALLVATNNGQHCLFGYHAPDPQLDDLDGKIIECKYNGNSGSDSVKDEWKFLRVRSDKISANYERVVDKIIDSIRDNVTSEELIKAIPEIRRNYKSREAALASKRPPSTNYQTSSDPKKRPPPPSW